MVVEPVRGFSIHHNVSISINEAWYPSSRSNKSLRERYWMNRIIEGHGDKANTREYHTRALVQVVTEKSESDAFKNMMNAHKTGDATVGNSRNVQRRVAQTRDFYRKSFLLLAVVIIALVIIVNENKWREEFEMKSEKKRKRIESITYCSSVYF